MAKPIQPSIDFKIPPRVRTTRNDTSNVNPINKPKFGPEVPIITKTRGK